MREIRIIQDKWLKKWGKTKGNQFYFELAGTSNYPSSNYQGSTVVNNAPNQVMYNIFLTLHMRLT